MLTKWNQAELQRHINDGVEESLTLDYKAGDALGTSDGKKKEITKDVSAFANSAGGIIIYGIKEDDEEDKKHLPEKFAPIDRTQFSKEWLEQVINTIQPRISGIIIHPVALSTGFNDVAYVVEIPQSTTAHQARDWRYYKRFNFESVPMNDYEVKDVMRRRTLPEVTVEFGSRKLNSPRQYLLTVKIKNEGIISVDKFKLQFRFSVYDTEEATALTHHDVKHRQGSFNIVVNRQDKYVDNYDATFWSERTLFPKEEIEMGEAFSILYHWSNYALGQLKTDQRNGVERTLSWTLFVDNALPKSGKIPFSTIHPI
jgi:hypothetical protein